MVEVAGPNSFFAYSAAIHFLTAGFAFYRMQRRAGVLPEDKEDFVHVPRASPEVITIDPRGLDADLGDEGEGEANKGG